MTEQHRSFPLGVEVRRIAGDPIGGGCHCHVGLGDEPLQRTGRLTVGGGSLLPRQRDRPPVIERL